MTARSEQKSKTRLDLISAGLKLSGQKGFSSLSLREVALEAGITPAAFYRHFHDMEELGLCMLDEVGLSLRQFLREARKKVGPRPHAIRISVESFLTFINENQNLFRMLLGERQGGSAAFRRATRNEMDRFVGELTADLLRIQEALGKPLKNPALAAESIVAVCFTIGAEALDLPPHKQDGLKERLISHVEVILRGSRDRKADISRPRKKRVSK